MFLTQLAIKNAKPREKPYKLRDGHGLYLLVSPNGSKLWRLRYRFSDKQNMLSFGAFPEVSLASARTKRDEARKLLAEGIDPSQQRRLDKITAASRMGEPVTTRKAAWFYNLELALLIDGSYYVSLAATTVDEEEPQLLCQELIDERVNTIDDAFARLKQVLTNSP